MRRVVALYRSSVGKKILMALTGFIWIGFLAGHMLGNLKAFQGAGAFDSYAHHLRIFGEPILPYKGFLWLFRAVMFLALVIHVLLSWQTSRQSWAARTTSYRQKRSLNFDFASQWMRWTGVIILAFLTFHILHMTTGTLHGSTFEAETTTQSFAFHNLVTGLANPWMSAIYLVAMVAILFHLWHGVWSIFQTLGASHPKYTGWRRPIAVLAAIVIFAGFVSIPMAILTHVVTLQ
jgi:succinate dehydrogenase cytochrome b subunit